APADHLAVLLRLLDEAQHASDGERAGNVTRLLDRLDLQAGPDQPLGDLTGAHVVGQLDQLAQPGNRDPHPLSFPSAWLKRTSPSTMSRMSSMPCRNINVRSSPMPKAKPEYRSGSTPHATRTRGFTTPQPPHSIQPSLAQVRQGRSGFPTDSPRQAKQRRSS